MKHKWIMYIHTYIIIPVALERGGRRTTHVTWYEPFHTSLAFSISIQHLWKHIWKFFVLLDFVLVLYANSTLRYEVGGNKYSYIFNNKLRFLQNLQMAGSLDAPFILIFKFYLKSFLRSSSFTNNNMYYIS